MKFCVLPGLLWAALSGHVLAHELQASRATLVLRDNQHLAITFFVDYPAVLHQALAPQMLFHEFALQHSAMPTPIFAAQVLLAQRKLQSGTRLMLRSGKAAPLTRGSRLSSLPWPAAMCCLATPIRCIRQQSTGCSFHLSRRPMSQAALPRWQRLPRAGPN